MDESIPSPTTIEGVDFADGARSRSATAQPEGARTMPSPTFSSRTSFAVDKWASVRASEARDWFLSLHLRDQGLLVNGGDDCCHEGCRERGSAQRSFFVVR